MNRSEALAKLAVENLLPGTESVFTEEQSSMIADFTLRFSTGEVAPMEVTRSTEPTNLSIMRALEKHNYLISTTRLENHWMLMLSGEAHVRKILQKAEHYLQKIEEAGIQWIKYFWD